MKKILKNVRHAQQARRERRQPVQQQQPAEPSKKPHPKLPPLPEFSPLQLDIGSLAESQHSGSPKKTSSLFNEDVLYVIGETHGVSEERREEEERFCKDVIGSDKYYKEEQFKEAKRDSSGELELDNEGNVMEGREPADPWDLRMLQSLTLTIDKINDIRDTLQAMLSSKSSKEDLEVNLSHNYHYMDIYMAVSREMCVLLEKEKDGFRWKELNGGKKAVDNLRQCLDRLKAMTLEFQAEHENRPEEEQLTLEQTIDLLKSPLNNYEKQVNIAKKLILKKNTRIDVNITTSEVGMLRSKIMHKTAQDRYKTKGVWKVGYTHQEHMKSYPNRKYQLISEKEFNSQLAQRKQEQQSTSDGKGK